MYKLGLALEKVNDTQGRDRVWEELLKKYPSSEEAGLVKTRLAQTSAEQQ
jgi:TolA-binding protein